MPFSPALRPAYDAYVHGCEHARVYCYRVDDIHSPGLITTDILLAIAHADVLIADLTNRNANVYYELGVAQAAGKEVVITCRNGAKLPFDIAQYRVIFYDATNRGLKTLSMRVAAYVKAAVARPGPPNIVFNVIHGQRARIITRLNQAVGEIVDKTKLLNREVGMHVYVPEPQSVLRRIARDTVRSVSSTPGSDRWRKGEGVVGTCWAENEKAVFDLQLPIYQNITLRRWAALRPELKFGMTYERFRKSSGHFMGLAAVPVRHNERFIGCVSVNIDKQAAGKFSSLWKDVVQPVVYSVASDVGAQLGAAG